MKEPGHITEGSLDAALNAFFLESDSAADDLAARFVFSQNYDVTIDPAKEKNLIARLKKNTNGGNGFNYFLIGGFLLIIIFFMVSIIVSNSSSRYRANGLHKLDQFPVIAADTGSTLVVTANDGKLTITPEKTKENSIPVVIQVDQPPVFFSEDPVLYGFAPEKPLFSEQDLQHYLSLKKIFLEKLLSFDKDVYTKVVEGQVTYGSEIKPVYPFAMRNSAVTNLEYKIFLADLVQNGKTSELNKALVRTGNWNNYSCPRLASVYFQDSRYNDFPVVNVSREGMLLYCEWLEEQVNQAYLLTHPKADSLKVRLPGDFEWLYAIRAGYSRLPDCSSGYNTIYDSREGLVDKSFLKRLALIRKRDRSKLTYVDGLYAINRYGMSENEIINIFENGLSYCADSLKPGEAGKVLKYLGKAGHVSELIRDVKGRTIVIGSCWASKEEYMKMVGEFNSYSASPFVGFRFIVTGESKGSPKNPFW
jgi:hypothetical protein